MSILTKYTRSINLKILFKIKMSLYGILTERRGLSQLLNKTDKTSKRRVVRYFQIMSFW